MPLPSLSETVSEAKNKEHIAPNEGLIPFKLPPQKELSKLRTAVLKTEKGTIIFELFPEIAPWHVANLKFLADRNFYDGLTFHIVKDQYIAQAGSPNQRNPDSGPGYEIPAEFSDQKHLKGALGMARRPDVINPARSSHGSQFHIILGDSPHMNGAFTVMGRVIRGVSVLDRLEKGDKIIDLTVYVKKK